MTFLLFVLVVILLFWVTGLSGRISELERKLGEGVVPAKKRKEQALPELSSSETPPPPPYLEKTASARTSVVRKTDGEMEDQIATSWLNKIGVVAIVLGMVFFFQYAISQGWIGPWLQIIIGFLVGGLLIYLGELWREKYGDRAHALSGGGVALLYFVTFAAYQFYSLMPYGAAFALIVCIAALSVFLSFRYNSLTLGVLGFLGAYGAPVMLSTGRDQQVAWFLYLSVLNVAVFITLGRKYWVELLALALIGTGIDYVIWAGQYSNSGNTFTSLYFLIFTLVLYTVFATLLVRRHSEQKTLPKNLDNNLGLFHLCAGLFFTIVFYILLKEQYHGLLPAVGVLGGIVYLFSYALVDRLEFKSINYALSFMGALMLVLAAVWQFDGRVLSLALLVLALLGATIGVQLRRAELRIWSLVVLFASLLGSSFDPYTAQDHVFLLNPKFGLMLAETLGFVYIAWLYRKIQPTESEKGAETLLAVVASILLWVSVTWELGSPMAGPHSGEWTALWWVVYPTALVTFAAAARSKALMVTGLLLAAASFVKVLVLPYSLDHGFLVNAKFGLMLAQVAAVFAIASWYNKGEEDRELSDIMKVAGSLLLWFSVSWEIVEYFHSSASDNTRNLSLSMWWIVYASIMMGIGKALQLALFRKVAIALFLLSVLKVFLYDVQALDTGYRIVSFIVLGVILLSVSFGYQKNKEKIAEFIEGE